MKTKGLQFNLAFYFLRDSGSNWLPVGGGESGNIVFQRADTLAYAKIAPAARRAELAEERDRLIWLEGRGVACPEVISWREEDTCTDNADHLNRLLGISAPTDQLQPI